VAAKTEAPTFTNDIVRSSCKLQIAAGGKPEGEEFREKRARHCLAELEMWELAVANATFGNRRIRILTVTCRTLAHCAIIVDCSW
jgi:hypothetical protein